MAEDFNPDVQNIDPTNFIGWSRPITGFQGNRANETLLKGFGEDLAEGANVVNKGVELNISDDINRSMSAIRDDYKSRLQTVYKQSEDNPDSLLPDDSGAPPKAVKDGMDHTFDTLSAARKSGKYSDTYLDMQYDDYLKEMRSKYPGYRQYIDDQAARSLDRGLPANREIRQLTSDINSNIQTAKEQREKAQDLQIAKLAAGGDPESQAVWQYKHLLPEKEKSDFIARKIGDQADITRLQTARNYVTDPGERSAVGRQEANLRLNTEVSNFVHTFTMGQSNTTPEQLVNQINNPSASDEQKAKARLTLQTYIQSFKARMEQQFSIVDPKTGRSLDQDIGGISGDLIDQHLSILKNVAKWVDNNKGGAVAVTVDNVKADHNPATKPLIPSDNKVTSDNVHRIVTDNPSGNDFLSGLATAPGARGVRAAANARHVAIGAGTDYAGNPDNPIPINQVMEEAKTKFSPDRVGEANSRDFFNNVVSWYKDILFQKDNPALQRNVAYSLYGPGNDDVLKHFPVETTSTKGQASVYNMWFSPAVDKEMFTQLGKADTNLLSSYEDLKKKSFGNYVLPGELHNMDGMPNVKDLKWSYDNVNHKITPYYTGDQPPQGFDQVLMATRRLNTGLAGIDSMGKYTREDTNDLLFQWLHEGGIGRGPASKAVRDAITQSFSSDQQKKQDAATKVLEQIEKRIKGSNSTSGSDDTDDDDDDVPGQPYRK